MKVLLVNLTYCASKVMFGRQVVYRSAKNVVDEIEHLLNDYGMEALVFSDDTFTIKKGYVKDICEEIKARELKFQWRVQVRADCIDEEMIKLLKGAGCVQFSVGVESGSEKVLKILKKGETPQQYKKAFQLIRENQISVNATFIIGNPEETIEDINETARLAREIKSDFTQFFITTPYPGTEMYNELYQSSSMVDDKSYRTYHHGGTELQSFIKNALPSEQLVLLQKQLNEEFISYSNKDIMYNAKFLFDTLSLFLQRPDIPLKGIISYIKTGSKMELYRSVYFGHNFRRF